MSTTIKGSVELITNYLDPPNATSEGLTVQQATVESVPILMHVLHGLTDLEPADPENGAQVAVWLGTNAQLRPVKVILWQDPAFGETLIGQILAMATEGGDV